MEFGFLFWTFLIGIVLASFQDLKRREVDNWLNLLILFSGIGFLIFQAVFENNGEIVILGIFCLLVMFILANLFYYGRVFAGGDAKLLFALFALFVAASLKGTMINIGWFVLALMVAGSVYGGVYSLILFIRNWGGVKKHFSKEFENVYLRYVVLAGVVLFVLSYFNFLFLVPAVLLFLGPILYVFAKSLENVVMIRKVEGKNLREGDWLAEDVRIGRKLIKSNWEGLTKKDLELLKGKKKFKIKEGLPFVPAFLIAFFLWWFRDFFIGLFI